MKKSTLALCVVIIGGLLCVCTPGVIHEMRDIGILASHKYTDSYVPAKVIGIMYVPDAVPVIKREVPEGAVVVDYIGDRSLMSVTLETSDGATYTKGYTVYPKEEFAVGEDVFIGIRYRPDGSILEYDILKESTSDK